MPTSMYWDSVVYFCIIFVSMHSIFGMTSRMQFKKRGLVILDWYFGERMETNRAVEKVKKRRECCMLTKMIHKYTTANPVIRVPCYLGRLRSGSLSAPIPGQSFVAQSCATPSFCCCPIGGADLTIQIISFTSSSLLLFTSHDTLAK